MTEWLKSVRISLINPNDITCSSPSRLKNRNIMSVSGEAFCEDPAEAASKAVKRTLSISLPSVFGVLAVLLSVGIIVYRLRVRLYSRWKFHPFDCDECLGEDLVYDVFLSCSSRDNLPHGNEIRQQLEQRGYRVCYPPRDFLAGASIHDNIYSAVVCSKRTVCFLTSQFLQRYCYTVWSPIGSMQPVVRLSVRLSVCLWRCAFWLSGLVYALFQRVPSMQGPICPFRHFCCRMYRLATKCTTKNEVRNLRNAISVYGTQAGSRKGTRCVCRCSTGVRTADTDPQ